MKRRLLPLKFRRSNQNADDLRQFRIHVISFPAAGVAIVPGRPFSICSPRMLRLAVTCAIDAIGNRGIEIEAFGLDFLAAGIAVAVVANFNAFQRRFDPSFGAVEASCIAIEVREMA